LIGAGFFLYHQHINSTDGPVLLNDEDAAYRTLFFHQRIVKFLSKHPEQRSMQTLADLIKEILPPFQGIEQNSEVFNHLSQTDEKLSPTDKEIEMLQTLIYTLPGEPPIASPFDLTNPQQQWLKPLVELRREYEVFNQGTLNIYATDQVSQLLAYELRRDDNRAYVIFNFSYDVHTIPLPFGFMSSTKIKLWQSDNPTIREFVTRSQLSIRPFSSAIIIVGKLR